MKKSALEQAWEWVQKIVGVEKLKSPIPITPTPSPWRRQTTTGTEVYWGKPEKNPFITRTPTAIPSVSPTLTPTSTATMKTSPTPITTNNSNILDFSEYKIKAPGFEGKTIPQPPKNIANVIWKIFGPTNEATPAAAVAWAENAKYNPTAIGQNYNKQGKPTTKDYGIWQVNSGTFDGLRTAPYWKDRMATLGINENTPYTVLLDPNINAQVALLAHQREIMGGGIPWGWWYGWQPPPLGKEINLQEMINKLKKQKKKK